MKTKYFLPMLLIGMLVSFTLQAQRQVFFTESFGEQAASSSTVTMAAFTDWHNADLVFSTEGFKYIPDVRNTYPSSDTTRTYYRETASGQNNLFFVAVSAEETEDFECGFTMSGIDASNFTDIQLQFGYNKQNGTDKSYLDVYFWDGSQWVEVEFDFNEEAEEPSGWYLSPVIQFPPAAQRADLALKFVKPEIFKANTLRLDDVWLTGVPKFFDGPTLADASNLSATGFTASWEAVKDATAYILDVSDDPTFASEDEADIIAAWNFEGYVKGDPVVASIYSPNNEGIELFWTSTGNAANPIPYPSGSGSATRPFSITTTGWEDGVYKKHITTTFDATGFYNLTVSSRHYSSGNGPKNMKLQYRLSDDADWIDVPNSDLLMPNADFGPTATLSDLALPNACDNQPAVSVRWTPTSSLRSAPANAVNLIVTSGGTHWFAEPYVNGKDAEVIEGYGAKVVEGTSHEVTGLEGNKTYYYRVRATDGKSISNASEVKQVTTWKTGIESVSNAKNFNVFYSAANDAFQVRTKANAKTITVRVADLNGRTLEQKSLTAANGTISASNYPMGVYVVTVYADGIMHNFKVVK